MMSFARSGKCWSRPVEIDDQNVLDPSPTSTSGACLPAYQLHLRRIRKDVDGSAAFDRLRLTHATLSALISMLCPPGNAVDTRRLMKTSLRMSGFRASYTWKIYPILMLHIPRPRLTNPVTNRNDTRYVNEVAGLELGPDNIS